MISVSICHIYNVNYLTFAFLLSWRDLIFHNSHCICNHSSSLTIFHYTLFSPIKKKKKSTILVSAHKEYIKNIQMNSTCGKTCSHRILVHPSGVLHNAPLLWTCCDQWTSLLSLAAHWYGCSVTTTKTWKKALYKCFFSFPPLPLRPSGNFFLHKW